MFSNMLMSNKVAAAGVWSPPDVFAAGELGMWYDPSDLSTLFQDTAGAVPVTASGQSVRVVKDKSGNNLHATIPAGIGTYHTDGVNHWLSFIDSIYPNGLIVPFVNTGNNLFGVAFGMQKQLAEAQAVLLYASYSDFAAVFSTAGNSTSAGIFSAGILSVNSVEVVPDTRSNFNLMLSSNLSVVDITDVVMWRLPDFGKYTASGFGYTGDLYGYIYSAGLTVANMPSARTWLGNKMGIVL